MDILHWLLGRRVLKLSSFGSLTHFTAAQAPEGAPARCTDGCPHWQTCPYYAPRLYLRDREGWPVNAITNDLSYEGRMEALQNGPYGRCVYHCDNDVVDHQVVMMQTESGTSISLTMHGHSDTEERTMRYDGTRATVRGRFGRSQQITIADHATGSVLVVEHVPGPTLSEVLSQVEHETPVEAVRSALRVADAVCAIHAAGGAHGLIRPASLIGSSGSGKSTLLRCCNLLEDSQQGDILFKGEPVKWKGEGHARRPADPDLPDRWPLEPLLVVPAPRPGSRTIRWRSPPARRWR